VTLLAISANDIDAAGRAVDAELPLVWFKEELADADLQGHAPGRVQVRLSRSGNDIVVRGTVKAELHTPCARCTEPASVPIDTELSLLLQSAPGAHAKGHGHGHGKDDEEYEFTSAEADVDTYDGETVILDAFIREAILLEVPNFPLCSEGCPGIAPAPTDVQVAEEPHLDPRLAPLGALRDKLQGAAPAQTKKKNKE
jgi:uncharacterized protein